MADFFSQSEMLELSDSELAYRLRDPAQYQRACEALVCRYKPLVVALAHQYQLPAQHYEDLTQVGYVGLMKAINSFDPAIRPELKPYARVCVSGEIKRYFRDKRWLIRVGRSDQELLQRVKNVRADLAAELGSTPTDEQIASRLEVSLDELRHAYRAHQAFAPGSLDFSSSADDEREPYELIGIDDPAFAHSDQIDEIGSHWGDLPQMQQRILLMRYYGNMTQAQVADRLHCSQMHISRLQARALAFLRTRLQTT